MPQPVWYFYFYDVDVLMITNVDAYTGWPKKMSWTFACAMQWSSQDKLVVKHVRNEQTLSNTSRNFHLKHFHISWDTNKIVFCIIKQIMQAAYHLCCRYSCLYAGYTRMSWKVRENEFCRVVGTVHQSTDQQKMCWISPPFCFAIADKCFFQCSMSFLILTVWWWHHEHLTDNILKISKVCKRFMLFS